MAGASAVGAAAAVLFLAPQPDRTARAQTAMTVIAAPASTPSSSHAIAKSADGHYWAEAQVDGAPVRFLVDTGATAVALTPADAQRLGIAVDALPYVQQVVTAGGQARAASVRLKSVTVAGVAISDVDALVIETGLDASLLGMSYLGRLTSFQATREALFLQP